MYEVNINGNILALPAKHLDVVVDLKAQDQAQEQRKLELEIAKGGDKRKGAANNRSSANAALQYVTSKIRAVIKKSPSSVENIFAQLDKNKSGDIDKEEFFQGCKELGVEISRRELDLVWPVFDIDGNGSLNIGEFISFANKGGNGQQGASALKGNQSMYHKIATHATVEQRQARIEMKSRLARLLQNLTVKLRNAVKEYTEANGMDAETLFKAFDTNKSGSISKQEFIDGLEKRCKCR